ncbi:ROK family protein [Nesterenkonia sedimenti]|uniref:ROK family protein n=1 Tax=Nesterenkonia sedimenti TaxID=1463632 RepID=UPI002D21856D|nr:ROK family protein [Nesterenkonia sedimenti]
MSGLRLGLDIGGTKIEGVALNGQGEVIRRLRQPTVPGADGVITGINDAVAQLTGDRQEPAASLGIGIPGQIDATGGRVRHAVNLQLEDLDLREALAPLGIPVRVENDVKAAALGAYTAHTPQAESMAYLNIGTGVAAGIVIDGKLLRGQEGVAGEIGHFSIDQQGTPCACGQRGCIETFTGGGAVSRAWGGTGQLPLAEIFEAAEAGEPRAFELREGMGRGISAAVQLLVLSMDVSAVLLGGGVTALGSRLEETVHRHLERMAADSPFIRSLNLTERVDILPAGTFLAPLGAAQIAEESSWN